MKICEWKNQNFFLLCAIGALAGFFFLAGIKVLAVDQIKTSETFIIGSESQINSVASSSFQIYIGDNLSGVTNPVKSAYFTVSGVYTGNGSIALKIDNDDATLKTFTLPNVGSTPTPFEIIYKDDTNKINPTSAGSYTYTLYITPSGVTISGLGAKINVTHQYAPGTCPDGSSANEKIKTMDFFIIGSESQITSVTSTPFTIYIGDNLAGVTNPVKSAYFTISGVYTSGSGGTIEFKIDNNASTTKTFSLPTASNPTPFEIIYKDDFGLINPASAGAYNYTLYITPSGVTISGLGAKATITHRYKPPSCGGGYQATGIFYSPIFDTGVVNGASFNWIMWKGSLNGGKIRLQLATSNSSGGPWDYIGPAPSCNSSVYFEPLTDVSEEIKCFSNHNNNKRYFRYKAILCSSGDCSVAGSQTPQVDDVIVNWSP